jgi:hypothetical protein
MCSRTGSFIDFLRIALLAGRDSVTYSALDEKWSMVSGHWSEVSGHYFAE